MSIRVGSNRDSRGRQTLANSTNIQIKDEMDGIETVEINLKQRA